MIAKLRALLGWFQSSSPEATRASPAPQAGHLLPDRHPEGLPVPRWEGLTLQGHVLSDQVALQKGQAGRNTLYGVEVVTGSGKRFTLQFNREVPKAPLVVGWQVHFPTPDGKKIKVGTVARILRLEPDGSLWVNLVRPEGPVYLTGLQGDTYVYLRQLRWEPL